MYSASLFEINGEELPKTPKITLQAIKKLGLEKSDTNLEKLINLFYENSHIDIKREITSSIGRQKNNDKIYKFLAKEAFSKHYMEVIYQMFRTCLYKSKDDNRFKVLRDKMLEFYQNEVMQKMFEYYKYKQIKKDSKPLQKQITKIKEKKMSATFKKQLTTNDLINNFYHSDCVKFMRLNMLENSVDLTLTSPPYDNLRNYNGYDFDFESIAKELFRITKNGGIVVWIVGDKIKNGNKSLTSFKHALYFQSIGFNVHDVMIYAKKNTPFMRSNAYTNCYEYMFIFAKGKPKTFNPIKEKTARNGLEMLVANKGADAKNNKVLKELKTQKTKNNIWHYAVGLGGSTNDKIAFNHPAIFPEKLAKDHILSWSNENDLVFDPMCGSGTTCKMAFLYNRNFIGVDISAEYIQIAKERLKQSRNLF